MEKKLFRKPVSTRRQVRMWFPSGINKLEIGSGTYPEQGYIHLDIQPNLPQLDIVGDARKMPIPNNWIIKEVRAVHIMEHFCHPKYSSKEMRKKYGTTLEVIKDCHRVLQPGGKLKIVTPDFEKISKSMAQKRISFHWLQRWTVGGHTNEYDIHHWLWTKADAYKWFKSAGFKNLKDWNPVKPLFPSWQLKWNTPDTQGNKDWHDIEWYHWLFIEGKK